MGNVPARNQDPGPTRNHHHLHTIWMVRTLVKEVFLEDIGVVEVVPSRHFQVLVRFPISEVVRESHQKIKIKNQVAIMVRLQN